ncbi:MAG: hypothetical protein Q9204_002554 [Flavoplaca sp. TL-2023a]
MASSSDPENMQWVYDDIDHYRFNTDIITKFLHDKWPDFDNFRVKRVGKKFRFWVPRKLTDSEQNDLFTKRLPEY